MTVRWVSFKAWLGLGYIWYEVNALGMVQGNNMFQKNYEIVTIRTRNKSEVKIWENIGHSVNDHG